MSDISKPSASMYGATWRTLLGKGEGGIEVLPGRRVLALSVSQDEDYLAIETDAGPIFLCVEGDCCSESWFADIIGVEALLGQVVLTAEPVDLPDQPPDGRCRQEEDAFYGFKVATAKGYCDFIYRCSSNGYYGGWMSAVATLPDKPFRAITEDWQA